MLAARQTGHHRGCTLRAGIFALAAMLGVVPAAHGDAVAVSDSELEIKAAMVYNIARFVEWPPERQPARVPGALFRLGVEGDDQLLAAFMTLAGRTVNAAIIEIVPIHTSADVKTCHLAYFATATSPLAADTAEATLTVSDADGFSRRGGMVELVRERNRIRFLVNPDAARTRGLQFSSQLLKLATIVEVE